MEVLAFVVFIPFSVFLAALGGQLGMYVGEQILNKLRNKQK